MAYSFTQIEKDRSRAINAAFIFLVFLYFLSIWCIVLLFRNFHFIVQWFNPISISVSQVSSFEWLDWFVSLQVIFWAFVIACAHWFLASYDLVSRITRFFKASPPDLNNEKERLFKDIVEEVCVATGGIRIQPMVIPTMMLNACAYADGRSIPVIALTKGTLNKLNRSQIEAVVGHEAAHIVSEDGQSTTIISSMFEIYGSVLLAFRTTLRGILYVDPSHSKDSYGGRWSRVPSGRGTGGGGAVGVVVFIILLVVLIWLINFFARIMRMFISRQREYRADAVAVRLTRNPLALAEALYIISHHRHSYYEGMDSLQSLFIVNPCESPWNDIIGPLADLFSTHPPVQNRIKMLLKMAHSGEDVLKSALKDVRDQEQQELAERQKSINQNQGGLWFAQTLAQQWVGPYHLDALLGLAWLNPATMIRRMGETVPRPMSSIQELADSYQKKLRDNPESLCPSCAGQLLDVTYESAKIKECQDCHGVLVREGDIGGIFMRKEKVFDQRIQDMARTLIAEKQLSLQDSQLFYESDRQYGCEKCKTNPKKMRRRLFNRFYPVEVDKCGQCGILWFDKDELEVMQCLYEFREASRTNI